MESSGGIDPTGASSSAAGSVITEGSRFFDRVMAEVHRQGPMPFDASECELIWKFVAVTPAEVINLFKGLGLHEHMCDPQARGVPPKFLADLAALTPGAPFVRAAILCLQYCSSNDECVKPGGASRWMANGVAEKHLKYWPTVPKKLQEILNGTTRDFLNGYVLPCQDISEHQLATVASALCMIARVCVHKATNINCSDGGIDPVLKRLRDVEEKLRGAFDIEAARSFIVAPPAVPAAPSRGKAEKARAETSELAEAPVPSPLKFKPGGEVVQNVVAKAEAANIFVGSPVILTKKAGSAAKGSLAKVHDITDKQLWILPAGAAEPEVVSLASVHPHVPEKPTKAEGSKAGNATDEPEVLDVTPFDLVSPNQTKDMLKSWVMCCLWRAQTVCGIGPDALLCSGAGTCVMNKALVADSMCLVPFSTILMEEKLGPDVLCTKITAEVAGGPCFEYWARSVSERFQSASGPERHAICPFFFVQTTAAAALSPYALCFKKVTMTCPMQSFSRDACFAPCKKQFNMTLSFQMLTNPTDLPKCVHIYAQREK